MTNFPDPHNESDSEQKQSSETLTTQSSRTLSWRRAVWIAFILSLLGVGGASAYGLFFIRQKLAPLVENNLEQVFNRPIELGSVKWFSLRSLTFDESVVPPTTEDRDRANIETVQIFFNPIALIFQRRLDLDITLLDPEIYIEQDLEGEWIGTRFQPRDEEGFFSVEVNTIRLENADLSLVGRSQTGALNPPVPFFVDDAKVNFLNDNQLIQIAVDAALVDSGSFKLNGEIDRLQETTQLALSGSELNVQLLQNLVQIPVNLEAGTIGGNLELLIRPQEPININGVATLNNVAASSPQLPAPIQQTNGNIRFQGTEIRLDNITSLFGQIPISAQGLLDTQGSSNLVLETATVSFQTVLETFDYREELPVPIAGEARAIFQVTGSLQQPIVAASVFTTQPTQIDRLGFSGIIANAIYADNQIILSSLRADLAIGGQILGQGSVQLGENGQAILDLQAQNLSGSALAQLYNLDLPVNVGAVSAQARIITPLENPAENFRLVSTNAIANVAGGTVNVSNVQLVGENRWNAQVQANRLNLAQISQFPPQLQQGSLNGSFQIGGRRDTFALNTLDVQGTANLNLPQGLITLPQIQVAAGNWQTTLATTGLALSGFAQVPPQLEDAALAGSFQLSGNVADFSQIRGVGDANINVAGGNVNLTQFQLSNQIWQGNLQASGIQLNRFAPQLEVPAPLFGNFQLSGNLAQGINLGNIQGTGNAQVNIGQGRLQTTAINISNGNFQVALDAVQVPLNQLAPQLPETLQAPLSGRFNLAGSLTELSPQTIRATGEGRLGIGSGLLAFKNLQVAQGRFQGNVIASNVAVADIAPQLPPGLQGLLTGTFNLAGNLDNIQDSLSGRGEGRLDIEEGLLAFKNLQVAQGRFQGNVIASNVAVADIAPQLPPGLQGLLTGTFNLAGNLDNIQDSLAGTGAATLALQEGIITAPSLQIARGEFEAILETEGIALAGFVEDLPGDVAGQIAIALNIRDIRPEAIEARGNIRLSEGIGFIDRPLDARFQFANERLEILEATAQNFATRGTIDLNLSERGLDIVENLNLAVNAQELDLSALPLVLPEIIEDLDLSGVGDFEGVIQGLPTSPNVQGNIALRNFDLGIEGLDFDSVLTGTVQAIPNQGATLNLTGINNQIQLALAPDNLPQSLLVNVGELFLQGERNGNLFLVEARSFPITLAQNLADLPPTLAARRIGGELSGEFALNLTTFGVSGDVAVRNPVFGDFRGDLLRANIAYEDGRLDLTQGEIIDQDSRYGLEGVFERTPAGPRFSAEIAVDEGRVETLIAALQVSTLEDLIDIPRGFQDPIGSADDLNIVGVGLPEETLLNQLRRFSEIQILLAQQRAEAETLLPRLDQLAGVFSGSLVLSSSPQEGLEAEFNLQGQNWLWDTYEAETITLAGGYDDGILTLVPLRIEQEDSLIAFSGTLGGEALSGQLRLGNIPVAAIQDLVELPPGFDATGDLSAVATIAGGLDNPSARGEITLEAGSISQTAIQNAQASFSYANARLNFSGNGTLSEQADPLTATGSIPFLLPFATAVPASNELNISIQATDNALALLNVISRQQVNWIQGKGEVDLDISGTYDLEANRPSVLVAEGLAVFEDAVIETEALPDVPLTEVSGRIAFNFDEIDVESFQGRFSEGQLVARGVLPISRNIPQEDPLAVTLSQLAFNLRGLYEGGVDGQLEITGNLLEPNIGGALDLANGRILLPENGDGAAVGVGTPAGEGFRAQVGLNNLLLSLGEDIQITRSPLLNFVGEGDLILTGTLANIRPEGMIELKRGQVNLFTTQFRLARGEEQFARFVPGEGLDPFLNVTLRTTVAETTRQPETTAANPAEIRDTLPTGFGSLESVRVTARVEGAASRLTENLELSSDPPRTESELVALIGGGFIDTFGRGDPTLGLVDFAATNLFGGVQETIRAAIGASDFRIYPTAIIDEEDRSESGIGVGGEVGFQITDNISASVVKVLTSSEPFRFGVIYRLNEDFVLRGSGTLEGEGAAAIQYNIRF